MGHPCLDLLDRNSRIQLEHLEVLRSHERLEGREIDHPGSWRAMIAARKLHVVDMEPSEPVGHRLEVESVLNEAKILFDLRVACVVPVADKRIGELFKEQAKITLERNLFDRFAVL